MVIMAFFTKKRDVGYGRSFLISFLCNQFKSKSIKIDRQTDTQSQRLTNGDREKECQVVRNLPPSTIDYFIHRLKISYFTPSANHTYTLCIVVFFLPNHFCGFLWFNSSPLQIHILLFALWWSIYLVGEESENWPTNINKLCNLFLPISNF